VQLPCPQLQGSGLAHEPVVAHNLQKKETPQKEEKASSKQQKAVPYS
jgi:hypothetical protein